MKLTERAEEILETLWLEVVENRKTPEVTILKDNSAFKELIDGGYVTAEGEKLLTARGMEEGRRCVRRHRLAERLLVDVLQAKGGLVHEAGCKLEHILHKGLEDNICILLGHPKTCPHGRPIPQGDCCKEKKRKSESVVVPLSELRNGQSGKIAYVQTSERTTLRKIMAMGALPGLPITLVQRFPSYVFQLGESQFAVDRELADQIQVWLLK